MKISNREGLTQGVLPLFAAEGGKQGRAVGTVSIVSQGQRSIDWDTVSDNALPYRLADELARRRHVIVRLKHVSAAQPLTTAGGSSEKFDFWESIEKLVSTFGPDIRQSGLARKVHQQNRRQASGVYWF